MGSYFASSSSSPCSVKTNSTTDSSPLANVTQPVGTEAADMTPVTANTSRPCTRAKRSACKYYTPHSCILFLSLSFLVTEVSHHPDPLQIAPKVKGKGKAGIAVHGTPSHSYGVSLAIWVNAVKHKRVK